ncbi:MAG: folate-binding protein YgfZ [Gammaproteobacteria bacterium]|nr:folate-binding protein YgfZ [Gammaproteobacteria bacterium]
MNSDWKNLLIEAAASFDDAGQCVFENTPESDCQKIPLTHLGIIRVRGEDKETFLQGQLTNDTRNINKSSSQLSGYCTPKGRMLANFRIFEDQQDNWYIVIPSERLSAILKRLSMFILRSNVEISDVSNEILILGLCGDCIGQALANSLPDNADEVTHDDSVSYIRVETSSPRYMVVGNSEEIMALWRKLDVAIPANTSKWRLGDIKAAIPTVFENTQEAFIPQMTNMHLINGVSFTKGCYTGQEIVARMQYLGKLKRRMYQVSFDYDGNIQPGHEIYSSISQSGQGAGKLVDAINTGDNHYEGLAVMEISSADEGEIRLLDENGPLLKINKPPYDFEGDSQS